MKQISARRQLVITRNHTIEFEIIVYPQVQVISSSSPLEAIVLVQYQLIGDDDDDVGDDGGVSSSEILAIFKQQPRSYAVMLCSTKTTTTTSASDFIQQQHMHYTHIKLQKDQLASR